MHGSSELGEDATIYRIVRTAGVREKRKVAERGTAAVLALAGLYSDTRKVTYPVPESWRLLKLQNEIWHQHQAPPSTLGPCVPSDVTTVSRKAALIRLAIRVCDRFRHAVWQCCARKDISCDNQLLSSVSA